MELITKIIYNIAYWAILLGMIAFFGLVMLQSFIILYRDVKQEREREKQEKEIKQKELS